MRRPRIGLALGSGAARGWAHVGVIKVLVRAGFKPDLVCGTSIGALVGAAYAAGELERFEHWLLGLRRKDVLGLMDFGLNGGMLKGDKLVAFFRRNFLDRDIHALDLPFAAVATGLHTGAEVWLREGSTIEAVRASIALPGLFAPLLRDGLTLVDGGLVNPVPVSLGRAMGADLLVAVDLNSDLLGRHRPQDPPADAAAAAGWLSDWRRLLPERLRGGGSDPADAPPADAPPAGAQGRSLRMPSSINVMAASINIMQVRISRSRMAGDPPDVTVTPRLGHLGLLDFHRAAEAIEAGERAMESALPALQALCED